MWTVLKTDRLRLRPLVWDDFSFSVALHADPAVAANLGHGRPRTEQETRAWFKKTLAWSAEDGLGHLAVVTQPDERLVGRCGLTCFELEADAPEPRAFWGRGSAPDGVRTVPVLEVGYAVHPDVWGQGLALRLFA